MTMEMIKSENYTHTQKIEDKQTEPKEPVRRINIHGMKVPKGQQR